MNDPPLERRRRVGDDSSATFSTADLPQADRIGLWEEYQDEHLIGLRCRTLDSGPFLATEVQAERGRVRLARVTGTPHLVERSGADIRRTPTESVVLYLGRGGESFFHHEHGTVVLARGSSLSATPIAPSSVASTPGSTSWSSRYLVTHSPSSPAATYPIYADHW